MSGREPGGRPSRRTPPATAPPATELPEWARLYRDALQRKRRAPPSALPAPPPTRTLSGIYYRQTSPRHRALEFSDPAPARGRYHVLRGEPRIYASSSEETAWGELFRHSVPSVSPFETKRRMSQLRVTDLRVLDLTDPAVRALIDVTERDLIGNRYGVCQRIAAVTRWWRELHGILAPSSAVAGMETLVIFIDALDHLEVLTERTVSPPRRLVYLFEHVIETLPARVRDQFYDFAREVRRRYRERAGR
jgi:RES domain-containing protein